VVITFIHNMRQSLILATHNAKLRHSQQNITTCKAGGFLGYNKIEAQAL
jgi:hypothetical protein